MGQIQKQYYTIGEVAKELALSTSLIRFWETEFKEIKPRKNRKGNRVYTPADIETLNQIKYLLKVKMFTIKGAKDQLKEGNFKPEMNMVDTLTKLKAFLVELKDSL